MFIGILFVIIGITWFLKDIGYLPADLNLWPIFFITLGLFILAHKLGLVKRKSHFCCFNNWKK